jgi:hypothetical protein
MSIEPDDVPDPLAGIDLRAWQSPAPPMGQIDAILSQITDHTRVDGAPAIEAITPPPGARQRTRWIALGAVVGAAAAVIVMLALWPRPDAPVPAPAPTKEVVVVPPPTPTQAGGTVAPSIAACRDLRASEDWLKVLTCANERIKTTGDQESRDLADQAKREAAASLAFKDLRTAVENKDEPAARKALDRIPADSVYYERAKSLFATLPEDREPKHVTTTDGDVDLAPCDFDALMAQAREAGTLNQWARMLGKAGAADACSSSKAARKLALLAACKLKSKTAADKYYAEFAGETAMEQVCAGVVGKTQSNDCSQADFDVFIDEAKDAGKANLWAKMLVKAEAANKCSPSKAARQLALMAACRLGNREKAARYWKEFENNSQMTQVCKDVAKD